MANTLVEKRNELDAKRKELARVWEEAGENLDFTKVKCLGDNLTTKAKVDLVNAKNAEINDLSEEIEGLVLAEAAQKADVKRQQADEDRNTKGVAHPPETKKDDDHTEIKSLGDLVRAHPKFQEAIKRQGRKQFTIVLDDVYPSQIKELGLKTLFETSAGWAPESVRTGVVVEAVTRPIQILDIIPAGRTAQAAVPYMQEDTRTHAAAEKAEGVAYAESTFVLSEQSVTVRKITDSVPVTDEQLDDVPLVESYLRGRLMFGVRQRLDSQILNGSTVAPELNGILNTAGIQTQAKGADPTPDAVYKAMTKVRVTGRAFPSAFITHPNDWQDIRLLRTTDGLYIWGNPTEAGPERIWGLPVAQSDAISENTGLVGDFSSVMCSLFERMGVIIEVGYVDAQFTEGKRTIRATMRGAMVWYRPAAYATVTGI